MTDRLDEADLLALIEGELDPDRAADLRRRLEADPQTRALVEGLGRDRDVLRSAPDPMVPRDFLADLEPLLARRMLTEVPVGEFRRRHARRQWPRWTTLAAAAAMLAIALLAGVWALGTGLLGPGSTPADNLIAFGDPEADLQASAAADHARARKTDRRAGEPGDPDPSAPTRGTIHHHKPSDGAAEAFAPFAVADLDDDKRRAGLDSLAPGARGPVVADFALFVFNDDEDLAEQAVQKVVAELGDRTALVRNFSYEEAERLERQWLIASSGRGRRRAEPAEAAAMDSVRSEMAKALDRKSRRYEKLADLARQQFREQGRGRADEAKLSEQLHGPPDRAPSLERQLELSRLGATHTIAIRVSQLNDLLARLTVGSGQTTALRMLPGPEEERDRASRALTDPAWEELGKVRQLVSRLAEDDADRLLLLPVVIRRSETE